MSRDELTEKLLTVGSRVRIWDCGIGEFYKIHIESVLQYPKTADDLHKVIVYRFYGKHNQRWHYNTQMLWEILLYNGYKEVIKELNLRN